MSRPILVAGCAALMFGVLAWLFATRDLWPDDSTPLIRIPLAANSQQTPDRSSSSANQQLRGGDSGFLNSDPGQLRASFEREVRSPNWAPEAEVRIRTAFASLPNIKDLNVGCRSSMCEVTGELAAVTTSNLDQVLGDIQSPDIVARLSENGFIPEQHYVFIQKGTSPVTISFSRMVARNR